MRLDSFILCVAVAAIGACAPEIGDSCTDALECSVDGTRICDTTQPDGYCLIPGCRANECPKESMCVRFGVDERARSFCMRHCETNGDCRNEYVCGEPDIDLDLSTTILDENPTSTGFCIERLPDVS